MDDIRSLENKVLSLCELAILNTDEDSEAGDEDEWEGIGVESFNDRITGKSTRIEGKGAEASHHYHMDEDHVTTTMGNIGTKIACLKDLSQTMEHGSSHKGPLASLKSKAPQPIFRVSNCAYSYMLNVRDRFKEADIALVERLGEANWQRHVAIRLRMNMESTSHEISSNKPLLETQKSTFVPTRLFPDSELESSLGTISGYASSTVSRSSFLTVATKSSKDRLRVPPTPHEVEKGIPFTCHICKHVLNNIKNRIDWKYVLIWQYSFRDNSTDRCVDNMSSRTFNLTYVLFPLAYIPFRHFQHENAGPIMNLDTTTLRS